MSKFLIFLIHTVIVFLLTIITQIGGIVYLIFLIVNTKIKARKLKAFGLFTGLYLVFTLFIIPIIAPYFGRKSLPLQGTLKPLTIFTCVLNRHYVSPVLRNKMMGIAEKMNAKFPGTTVNYLDANFPFFDGFPLMPHLSHNDGKKIDFAFFYNKKTTGTRTDKTPSFIGYGAFDRPAKGEMDFPERCRNDQYIMYNVMEFIEPLINDRYQVDVERTRDLIILLAQDPQTTKIFIEPHLKSRWKLESYDKIRFQGCHSVRHDDHIHVQIL